MIDPAQSAVGGRLLDFLLLPVLADMDVFKVSATEGDVLDEAKNRLVNKGGCLGFRGESSDAVLEGASTA